MDKTYLNNLGAEASSAGDYEKAEKYFRKALEISSDDPLICYNIGFVLLKMGDKAGAVRWFDTALTHAKDLAFPDADGISDTDAAGSVEDNVAGILKGKLALDCGLACFEEGMYEKADIYYQTASVTEKESGEYWNRLGVLNFVTEKYSDAMKCFEKAVLIDPHHIDAWYNLSDTYEVLGFEDKAARARKEFLALENKKEE